MSKTVQINQLFVLVSVLVGVELFGLVGALLAIPAAGVLQVVVRDVWDHRKGRFKAEPTIGEDQIPVSEHLAEKAEAEAEQAEAEAEPAELAGDGQAAGAEPAPAPSVRQDELARVADAPPPPRPPSGPEG